MAGPWHIVTGEYPPQPGGVSDYTSAVARALAAAGDEVHVWVPVVAGASVRAHDGDVRIHGLADGFGERGLRALSAELDGMPGPRTVLVQYVPHAFGARGMNIRFSRWVQTRARHKRDDVRVMFHEPYYPFAAWPVHRNLLALANRLMAVLLLSDIRVAYVSTAAWQRRLSLYAPRMRRFEWLPIPSAIPSASDAGVVAVWRRRLLGESRWLVGHFGTYGGLVTRLLGPALSRLLEQRSDVALALVGPGGTAFADRLCTIRPAWRARITTTERLEANEVAACIRACDVMVQPYADGVSGRRTTLMAALVNAVAVVTNHGRATEPIWGTSGGVELCTRSGSAAMAGAVTRLLDDVEHRRRVGAAGADLYTSQFALAHTIALLRTDGRASGSGAT